MPTDEERGITDRAIGHSLSRARDNSPLSSNPANALATPLPTSPLDAKDKSALERSLIDLLRFGDMPDKEIVELLATVHANPAVFRSGMRAGLPIGVTSAVVHTLEGYWELLGGLAKGAKNLATGDSAAWSAAAAFFAGATGSLSSTTPDFVDRIADRVLEFSEGIENDLVAASLLRASIALNRAAAFKRRIYAVVALSAEEILTIVLGILEAIGKRGAQAFVKAIAAERTNAKAVGDQVGQWCGAVIATSALFWVGV